LAAARYCRDELGFSHVLFVPCGDGSRKPELIQGSDRLELLRAAIQGESSFEIEEMELYSSARLQVLQTLRALRERWPEDQLSLFRGEDALRRTHRKLFKIRGLRIQLLRRAGAVPAEETIARSSTLNRCRDRIDLDHHFSLTLSSTAVRRAIQVGRSTVGMLPEAVARLILERGLYR